MSVINSFKQKEEMRMFNMKKYSLALSLVALPTLAAANIVAGISYKGYIGNNNTPDANGYDLTLGTNVIDNLKLDLNSEFTDYSDTKTNGNRLEVGLTPSYQFTSYPVGVYGRLALGNQWFSGLSPYAMALNNSTSFGYGSVEPGVFYKPYKDNSTGISLGYRFRGAFNDQPDYNSNAVILKGQYQIDKHNSVIGGYEYINSIDNSDLSYNVLSVGYQASF